MSLSLVVFVVAEAVSSAISIHRYSKFGLTGDPCQSSIEVFKVPNSVNCSFPSPTITHLVPEFTKPMPNFTVKVGSEVGFVCSVENLGKYKIAWVREDTREILAVRDDVLSSDSRFSVFRNGSTWTMFLRNVLSSDDGKYLCVIDTKPILSQESFLIVEDPISPSSSAMNASISTTLTTTLTTTTTTTTKTATKMTSNKSVFEFLVLNIGLILTFIIFIFVFKKLRAMALNDLTPARQINSDFELESDFAEFPRSQINYVGVMGGTSTKSNNDDRGVPVPVTIEPSSTSFTTTSSIVTQTCPPPTYDTVMANSVVTSSLSNRNAEIIASLVE